MPPLRKGSLRLLRKQEALSRVSDKPRICLCQWRKSPWMDFLWLHDQCGLKVLYGSVKRTEDDSQATAEPGVQPVLPPQAGSHGCVDLNSLTDKIAEPGLEVASVVSRVRIPEEDLANPVQPAEKVDLGPHSPRGRVFPFEVRLGPGVVDADVAVEEDRLFIIQRFGERQVTEAAPGRVPETIRLQGQRRSGAFGRLVPGPKLLVWRVCRFEPLVRVSGPFVFQKEMIRP
jgi:hypothetical protein